MKTLLSLLFALPLLLSAQSAAVSYKPQPIVLPADTDLEKVKDLANQAVTQLVDDFMTQTANLSAKRFAVLPLKKDIDYGYVTLQLQNHLSAAGGKAGLELYTRENEVLNSLLSEIQWGQDFGDTMESTTIQKFGRVNGVQGIIFSRVDVTPGEQGALIVRVNMQASEVETGRTLWGGEKKTEQAAKITPPTALEEAQKTVEASRPYWKKAAIGFAALIVLFWIIAKVRRASQPR